MTERGRASLYRSRSSLIIGPSLLAWDGDALTIRIEEITAPIPSSLRGVVRICPKALTGRTFTLDPAGRHRWWPIAPSAHVQVTMERPAMRWQGSGYLDTNAGDEPIEDAFQSWHWSRADLRPGTGIFYDVTPRSGAVPPIALHATASGELEEIRPAAVRQVAPRPAGTSRVRPGPNRAHRRGCCGRSKSAPFYARSLLATRFRGRPAIAVQESLSLDRFGSKWVQAMLPFRMPRAWR